MYNVRSMLDQRTVHHFKRLLIQNNPISDLIHEKAHEIADEEGLPILESSTESTAPNL
jgi:hypothetical protein